MTELLATLNLGLLRTLAWRAANPAAAWATVGVLGYTLYRAAGWHRKPLVVLAKHAATALVALAVAPLANLVPSSVPRPPVDPSSITTEWVTWVLRKQKLLSSERRVTSVAVAEFEAGKTGRSGRVALTYDGEAGSAPRSIVVKMSRADFKGRFLNLVLFLSREAHFFAEMGTDAGLITQGVPGVPHDPLTPRR
jgi:hypothetical protein